MNEKISNSEPDWSREKPLRFWVPGQKLLKTIRCYQKHKEQEGFISKMICKFAVIRHGFWSAMAGSDIPLNSQIGGGLLMPHPNGVVISPKAKIGVNCLIFQQVTLGSRGEGAPIIGNHVDIGAGAKLLGNIVVGDDVKIGANAVVIDDIPSGCTAVGIPATVSKSKNY